MSHATFSDALPPAEHSDHQARHISYRQWSGATLGFGELHGVRHTADSIVFERPVGTMTYTEPFAAHAASQEFEYARWTSPEVRSSFSFTNLVASWEVSTPEGSWVEVAVKVYGTAGGSQWLLLARWAGDDSTVRPASVPGQADATGRIATDSWLAADGNLGMSWQLRITLFRPVDSRLCPSLHCLGAMVSALPETPMVRTRPGIASGTVLEVPAYSQRLHAGQYPHWDGGGDSWCSPTATSMVMRYWSPEPDPAEFTWVNATYSDRHIHHAVRHCFDYSYDSAGNWSFNTAYAANYGLNAFVTRLRDLSEAEEFIAAGIPLVASIRVFPDELDGAGYSASGHLLVIAGFTLEGDVVCHDPAAPDNASVRRIYRRHQLEHAWLAASGGIVYVIHPPMVRLPPTPPEANW
ncbi:MAG: C39 family peptidase [Longispora sp.]|nr:C39 family peptidase [Longispora sp. (in: high G+C Gram-positive bacteria)]